MIMSNGDGRKYASVWNDMPVDVDHMQVWTEEQDAAGREDGQVVVPRVRQEPAEEIVPEPEPGMPEEMKPKEMPEEEPGIPETEPGMGPEEEPGMPEEMRTADRKSVV